MGRKRPPRVSGVALVDKPAGCTSHDVVQSLRRSLGQSQVGHTGTLDPAATGLMVVTLGRATRIGRFLEATDKGYVGTVRLGRSTTTWDAAGDTVEEGEVPHLERRVVVAALAGLVGRQEQVVPAFSAVKVDGQRLYNRARKGEVVAGPTRTVEVFGLELVEFMGRDIRVRADVGKGTYIRSLAVEIGRRLGAPAHLAELRRIRVGPHRVGSAHRPERFSEPEPPIMTAAQALGHLPLQVLDRSRARDVSHGRRIRLEEAPIDGPLRLVDHRGVLLAVARSSEAEPGALDYDVVLVRPDEVEGTV